MDLLIIIINFVLKIWIDINLNDLNGFIINLDEAHNFSDYSDFDDDYNYYNNYSFYDKYYF